MSNPHGLGSARALLTRPRDQHGQPALAIELILEVKASLAIPQSLWMDLQFANGLGSESWKEERRDTCERGRGVILRFTPARQPTVAAMLFQAGRDPSAITEILLRATGFELHLVRWENALWLCERPALAIADKNA